MKVGVLGPLVVEGPGGPVPVPGAKERVVLAHLVAQVGQAVSVEALLDSLWPDGPPATAAKTLQSHVARLRAALRVARNGQAIVHEGRSYRLLIDPGDVDASRFAELVALGRRALADGRCAEALRTLTDALALWRGPAYGEFAGTVFGRAEAGRLDELRIAAQELAWEAQLLVAGGVLPIGELQAHVTAHPLRESGWALLARAHAADGNQGAALEVLARARRVLDEELGVLPGPDLADLLQRVLEQDPLLLPRARSLPPALTVAGGPLVGRSGLVEALLDEWRAVQSGPGTRIWLVGPPASGRWRVACEVAARIHDAGGRVSDDAGGGQPAGTLQVIDRRRAMAGAGQDPVPAVEAGVLQLVAAERAELGTADRVMAVPALTARDVEALLVWYDPGGATDPTLPEVAGRILTSSGGTAGTAADLALRWARDRVSGRVAQLAEAGEESVRRVTDARAELASGVEQWSVLNRRARADPGDCPWRGLAWYEVTDGQWFAGRERLTAELVARTATDRALLLVGDSGAGKSSLLRAGLVASLAAGALPGSEGWGRVLLRPGVDPLRSLADAFGVDRPAPGWPGASAARRAAASPGGRVLVVVDQLDECWTACEDPGSRSAFLAALGELVTAGPAVSLVLAIRSDHAGRLAQDRRLAAAVAGSTVLVGAMSEVELRRAIEAPAARAGLVLQDGLVDALVSDSSRQPGGLPLLSTALVDLWESRDGATLTLPSYVANGGVAGAIARMAEGALAELDEPHRVACRTLFRRLVGPGEREAPALRRVLAAELLAVPDPLVAECIDPLVEARLLTASDGYVEIAHEALLRSWPRLRDWLADDAAIHATAVRLATSAQEWDRGGRADEDLWVGPRLATASDLMARRPEALTGVEREFVAAGERRTQAEQALAEQRLADARRQNRRLRWATGLIAGSLVVSVLAGALTVDSRSDARAAERMAVAQRLAASALNEPDLTKRMLTAVEGVRTEVTPDTLGALLTLVEAAGPLMGAVDLGSPVVALVGVGVGPTAVAAAASGDLVVLDLQAGQRRTLPLEEQDSPNSLVVSPDGRLAAVSYSSRLRIPHLEVIELATGRTLWSVDLGTGRVGDLDADPMQPAIAFNDTSDGLLALTREGLLEVELALALDGTAARVTGDGWANAGLGAPRLPQRLVRVAGPELPAEGQIRALGSGQYLVLANRDPGAGSTGSSVVVHLEPGRSRAVDAFGTSGVVGGGSGRVLAAWGSSGGSGASSVRLGALGEPEGSAAASAVEVPSPTAAAFSPDGSTLLTGSADGTLRWVDLSDSTVARTVSAHDGPVSGIVVAPDGTTVWTAGADGALRRWDLAGNGALPSSRQLGAPVTEAWPSADGRLASVLSHVDGAGEVSLLELTGGRRLLGPFPPPADSDPIDASASALTPDGSTLVVGLVGHLRPGQVPPPGYLEGRGLQLIDVATRQVRASVALPGPARSMSMAPDGRTVAIVGEAGVAIVDVRAGRVVDQVGLIAPRQPARPTTIEYSPDGRRLAVVHEMGDASPRVSVLAADTLDTVSSWSPGAAEQIVAMAWTGDATLATGGRSGQLVFRSAEDGMQLGEPVRLTSGEIVDLAVSPDRNLLAGLVDDGRVWLFSVAQRRSVGRPLQPLPSGRAGALRFDRTALEVLTEAGTALRYPLAIDELVSRVCALAGREPTSAEWRAMHGDTAQRQTCGDAAAGSL